MRRATFSTSNHRHYDNVSSRYFGICIEGVPGNLIIDDNKLVFRPSNFEPLRRGEKTVFLSWEWQSIELVEAFHPRKHSRQTNGRLELHFKNKEVISLVIQKDVLSLIVDDVNERLSGGADGFGHDKPPQPKLNGAKPTNNKRTSAPAKSATNALESIKEHAPASPPSKRRGTMTWEFPKLQDSVRDFQPVIAQSA